MSDVARAEKTVKGMSAWRIEGTLREFPAFDALNLWFDYPIHKSDATGVLKDCNFEGDFKINGKTVVTKALDDRFGCYVLINLIKSEPEYDMYFTFVVQEEVGLRGARPAAFTVNPDFALVIESTTAADVAEVDVSHQVCNLS